MPPHTEVVAGGRGIVPKETQDFPQGILHYSPSRKRFFPSSHYCLLGHTSLSCLMLGEALNRNLITWEKQVAWVRISKVFWFLKQTKTLFYYCCQHLLNYTGCRSRVWIPRNKSNLKKFPNLIWNYSYLASYSTPQILGWSKWVYAWRMPPGRCALSSFSVSHLHDVHANTHWSRI